MLGINSFGSGILYLKRSCVARLVAEGMAVPGGAAEE